MVVALRLVLAAVLVAVVDAFWLKLTGEGPVCLVEEVGYGVTVAHVSYNVRMRSRGKGESHKNKEGLASMQEANMVRPFNVRVLNPEKKEILNRNVGDIAGSIGFKIEDNLLGEYDVCFSAAPTARATKENPIETEINIDHRSKKPKIHIPPPRKAVKGSQVVYSDLDAFGNVKERLKTQEEITHISEGLEDIKANLADLKEESSYFKRRQARFVSTTDSTYARVWVTSFITVGIVIVSSVWQYFHLKHFLRAKKMI